MLEKKSVLKLSMNISGKGKWLTSWSQVIWTDLINIKVAINLFKEGKWKRGLETALKILISTQGPTVPEI